MKNLAVLLSVFMLQGCVFLATPTVASLVLNANSAYDVYSISKDKRDLTTIASDSLIKAKVQSKLLFSRTLSYIDIDVECFDGGLLLIGEVDTPNKIDEALMLARQTQGVKDVKTYLLIKDKNSCGLGQNLQILAAIKESILRDKLLNFTSIKINVVQCDIVLSGILKDSQALNRVLWYASHTQGVRDVFSFLILKDSLKS